MPIWVDPTVRIPYVLEADRGKPASEQTTFYFRVMRASDHARFSDSVVVGDDDRIANWTHWRLALLRYTLVGWEGPSAPAFEADSEGYPTEQCLSRLHYEVRSELATAANEANKVTDEDAGKSEAQ